ncbi:MAG: SMP-30/gluconolactonase/LRE family protein [Bauldia sp.]|nr:SMP-30/gluconolactonase/LRE family protein [Bauldia sp.]
MVRPEVLYPAASRLAESAMWHVATGSIFWLDLLDCTLSRHDLPTGETATFPVDIPVQLGALVATSDPSRLLVSGSTGISVIRLDGTVERTLADPEGGRDAIGYNDCKMDRFGRLWFGTHHLPETEPRGVLWSLRGGGPAQIADAGFPVSNGPAVSPDGRRLYFNDSVGRRTFVYDLDPDDPQPRNRRVFAEHTEGLPDGATVDAEGGLWVAFWAGSRVARFSPDGKVTDTISLPCPNVTSVAFAGDDLATLVITTAREGMTEAELAEHPEAGHIFTCAPGHIGLAEPLFDLR